jgi:hypothetical protein
VIIHLSGLWTKHLLRMFLRLSSAAINQLMMVRSAKHIFDMLQLRHRMCTIFVCSGMHSKEHRRKSAKTMFGEVGDRLVRVCVARMGNHVVHDHESVSDSCLAVYGHREAHVSDAVLFIAACELIWEGNYRTHIMLNHTNFRITL